MSEQRWFEILSLAHIKCEEQSSTRCGCLAASTLEVNWHLTCISQLPEGLENRHSWKSEDWSCRARPSALVTQFARSSDYNELTCTPVTQIPILMTVSSLQEQRAFPGLYRQQPEIRPSLMGLRYRNEVGSAPQHVLVSHPGCGTVMSEIFLAIQDAEQDRGKPLLSCSAAGFTPPGIVPSFD